MTNRMMTENKNEQNGQDRRVKLQTLWTFAILNYVYAAVVTFFDKTIVTSLSQTALLEAAILVGTGLAMILLTRILKQKANRWANIIVGATNTIFVLVSSLVATPAPPYIFFAAIGIMTTIAIMWYAWSWHLGPGAYLGSLDRLKRPVPLWLVLVLVILAVSASSGLLLLPGLLGPGPDIKLTFDPQPFVVPNGGDANMTVVITGIDGFSGSIDMVTTIDARVPGGTYPFPGHACVVLPGPCLGGPPSSLMLARGGVAIFTVKAWEDYWPYSFNNIQVTSHLDVRGPNAFEKSYNYTVVFE